MLSNDVRTRERPKHFPKDLHHGRRTIPICYHGIGHLRQAVGSSAPNLSKIETEWKNQFLYIFMSLKMYMNNQFQHGNFSASIQDNNKKSNLVETLFIL